MDVGLSKVIITPSRGLPLAGYFNPRPNMGVLDDLHVRCILFRQGQTVCGLVSLDLCMVSIEFIDAMLVRLKAAGFRHGRKLIITATHTHTAPYAVPLFGTEPDADYLDALTEKIVEAVLTAQKNLAPALLKLGSAKDNRLAFNRRYWMQCGGVVTNPGKGNPQTVKPEGPVDREIGVLSIEQDGRTVAIIANIVNHTDTIGGSLVSADWTGRMERGIQAALGYDAMVMTLIGCSGNINHFDVNSEANQSSYSEACRIGKIYAECLAGQFEKLKPVEEETQLAVSSRRIIIPFRTLTDEECRAARAVLDQTTVDPKNGGDLTSEGLATGTGAVARFFAEQTLAYKANCSGKKRTFRLMSLAFGDCFAITSLPGEPFTEVGLAVKQKSPFKTTWPVSLAMGTCGYVPLAACFERGGYEILPVEGGSPREDTAEKLIENTLLGLQSVYK